MVAAEIKTYIDTADPSVEVVYLEADHSQTYTSRKFSVVDSATLTMNQAAAITDSWYTTLATNVVTFGLVGTTTNVLCTLVLRGRG